MDDSCNRGLRYIVSMHQPEVMDVRWRIGVAVAFLVALTASGSIVAYTRLSHEGMEHLQKTTGVATPVVRGRPQRIEKSEVAQEHPQASLERRFRIGLESLAHVKQEKDPSTVLLIGTDSRHGEAARSDAMILTRVDLSNHKALFVSIPRDTRVLVPGYGYTKINHALAYGDVSLLKRTVEQKFGIPVDHAVMVDFAGFAELIDALGGVQVYIDKPLNYDDCSDGTHIHLKSGLQRLDGKSALDYVRFRHDLLADTGRMQRQRNLLHAIARTPIPIERWWGVGMAIPHLTRHLHSDLSQLDLLSEVAKIALSSKWTIATEVLQGVNRVDPADGLWYFYLDGDGVKQWRRTWSAFGAQD